jgi:DNA-binding Lrp family transcriptional regulator
MIDEKDARILEALQKEGRTSNVELARVAELTPSATLERVRKLEERGLIKGYMALLEPQALELGLLAFIFVRVDDRDDVLGQAESTAEALAALPSVQELHQGARTRYGRSLSNSQGGVRAVQDDTLDAHDDCVEDCQGDAAPGVG